ncbi:hypothetical protein [Streptomyces sp. BF23-19]|uniref:hypothetical protein n=1 Tax=unclassified Streptomyces TaxID=2593676 RepID=UPI0034E529DF
MPDTINLADDPDLAHLVDLIDMLPDPEVSSFWDAKHQGGSTLRSTVGHRLTQILKGRGQPSDVDYLAVYVLKYLGRGNSYIPEAHLTKHLTAMENLPAAGHAWVEDATRTAWTLVTRYSLPNWRGKHSTPGQAWIEN